MYDYGDAFDELDLLAEVPLPTTEQIFTALHAVTATHPKALSSVIQVASNLCFIRRDTTEAEYLEAIHRYGEDLTYYLRMRAGTRELCISNNMWDHEPVKFDHASKKMEFMPISFSDVYFFLPCCQSLEAIEGRSKLIDTLRNDFELRDVRISELTDVLKRRFDQSVTKLFGVNGIEKVKQIVKNEINVQERYKKKGTHEYHEFHFEVKDKKNVAVLVNTIQQELTAYQDFDRRVRHYFKLYLSDEDKKALGIETPKLFIVENKDKVDTEALLALLESVLSTPEPKESWLLDYDAREDYYNWKNGIATKRDDCKREEDAPGPSNRFEPEPLPIDDYDTDQEEAEDDEPPADDEIADSGYDAAPAPSSETETREDMDDSMFSGHAGAFEQTDTVILAVASWIDDYHSSIDLADFYNANKMDSIPAISIDHTSDGGEEQPADEYLLDEETPPQSSEEKLEEETSVEAGSDPTSQSSDGSEAVIGESEYIQALDSDSEASSSLPVDSFSSFLSVNDDNDEAANRFVVQHLGTPEPESNREEEEEEEVRGAQDVTPNISDSEEKEELHAVLPAEIEHVDDLLPDEIDKAALEAPLPDSTGSITDYQSEEEKEDDDEGDDSDSCLSNVYIKEKPNAESSPYSDEESLTTASVTTSCRRRLFGEEVASTISKGFLASGDEEEDEVTDAEDRTTPVPPTEEDTMAQCRDFMAVIGNGSTNRRPNNNTHRPTDTRVRGGKTKYGGFVPGSYKNFLPDTNARTQARYSGTPQEYDGPTSSSVLPPPTNKTVDPSARPFSIAKATNLFSGAPHANPNKQNTVLPIMHNIVGDASGLSDEAEGDAGRDTASDESGSELFIPHNPARRHPGFVPNEDINRDGLDFDDFDLMAPIHPHNSRDVVAPRSPHRMHEQNNFSDGYAGPRRQNPLLRDSPRRYDGGGHYTSGSDSPPHNQRYRNNAFGRDRDQRPHFAPYRGPQQPAPVHAVYRGPPQPAPVHPHARPMSARPYHHERYYRSPPRDSYRRGDDYHHETDAELHHRRRLEDDLRFAEEERNRRARDNDRRRQRPTNYASDRDVVYGHHRDFYDEDVPRPRPRPAYARDSDFRMSAPARPQPAAHSPQRLADWLRRPLPYTTGRPAEVQTAHEYPTESEEQPANPSASAAQQSSPPQRSNALPTQDLNAMVADKDSYIKRSAEVADLVYLLTRSNPRMSLQTVIEVLENTGYADEAPRSSAVLGVMLKMFNLNHLDVVEINGTTFIVNNDA